MRNINSDCIFCRIIAKEVPALIVYEDDNTIAFLDIKPISKGHTLVVPKEHSTNLTDISEKQLCNAIKVIKRLSISIMKAVGADGFNVGMNNFKAAGQLVNHTHFHIIPRFYSDNLKSWEGKEVPNEIMENIAEKIRNLLN